MSPTELDEHIERIKSHKLSGNSIGYHAPGENNRRSFGSGDAIVNMTRLMESGVTHSNGLVIFVYRLSDKSAELIAKALKSGKCAANLTLVFYPDQYDNITKKQKNILNKAWQHYQNKITSKTNITASSRLFNQAKPTIATTPAPNKVISSSRQSTLPLVPLETLPPSYDEAVAALAAIRMATSVEESVASASIRYKK